MRDILNIGAIITTAFAMSACATARPQNYIDAEARPLIKKIDSVLISPQKSLDANVKVSKLSLYAQGHFVPILLDVGINVYRAIEVKKMMAPIRETMGDYDYKQVLKTELNEALVGSGLEGAGELSIIREEPLGFRAAYVSDSQADAVMFIDVKYVFPPDFSSLNVLSSVMVFPVDEALSPYKEKPDTDDILEFEDNIYRNQFAAVIPVRKDKSKVGTKAENNAIWAAMSEAEITGLMELAARRIADVIADDLRIDDLPDATQGDITDAPEVIPEIELPDFTKNSGVPELEPPQNQEVGS